MDGQLMDYPHVCDPPFMLHPGEAWLGRVWLCDTCRVQWRITGILGKNEHTSDITWYREEPQPVVMDAPMRENLVALDKQTNDWLKRAN